MTTDYQRWARRQRRRAVAIAALAWASIVAIVLALGAIVTAILVPSC